MKVKEGGGEDEEVARISEATPDLLATTTIRQRRNSRSSLLDEIVQKVDNNLNRLIHRQVDRQIGRQIGRHK